MSKHPFGFEEPSLVPWPPARTTTASSPAAAAPRPASSHRAICSESAPSFSPSPFSSETESETTESQGVHPALRAAVEAEAEADAESSLFSAPSAAESATASAGKSIAATSALRRARWDSLRCSQSSKRCYWLALAAAATSSAGGGGGEEDEGGGGDAAAPAIEDAITLTSMLLELVEKKVTLPCLCGRGEGTPPQKRDRRRRLTMRAREPATTLRVNCEKGYRVVVVKVEF